MTRARRTELRLGALASLLLPLIAKDPRNAYAYTLHKKIVAAYGDQFASMSDVCRALQLLAERKMVTAETEQHTNREQPRVFYLPTFLAGFVLGKTHPMTEWESLGLAPKPEPVRKAS